MSDPSAQLKIDSQIDSQIDTQTDNQIVGLGEILWDVFPDGARFGGAPANFACSAAGLAAGSARVGMAGAVGRDDLGQRALAELTSRGVAVTAVAVLPQPTGRVDVTVDLAGHASYVFAPDCAWDNVPWSDSLERLAAETSAVCFGTLSSRGSVSLATIRRFVAAVPSPALRILDINLRPPFWSSDIVRDSLPLANVVKCNDDELPVVAEILGLTGSPESILRQLVDRHALRLAALTRGAKGSLLVTADGAASDLPGTPVEVIDTVGAGDAFTAAVTLGLLAGWPLSKLHAHAERVAAYVCTQPGGTPPIPADLRIG
ncbi:MAG: PfkB family carbohydrate kinase [Planctomycetia bacterium]